MLITNDSDLLEPVRMARQDLGLPVGSVSPYARPSRALAQHVTFVKTIRPGVLRTSQFANPLSDAQGVLHKPASW